MEIIFSQFYRLEVQDQCAVRVVCNEASIAGLHMAASQGREISDVFYSSYWDTYPMTSFHFNYLRRGPNSKYNHIRS